MCCNMTNYKSSTITKKGKVKAPKAAPTHKAFTQSKTSSSRSSSHWKHSSADSEDDTESSDTLTPPKKPLQKKQKVQEHNKEVEIDDEIKSDIEEVQTNLDANEIALNILEVSNSHVNHYKDYNTYMAYNRMKGATSSDQDRATISNVKTLNGDSMHDVLTIFTTCISVKFKEGNSIETIKGRWCLICKWVVEICVMIWKLTELKGW